MAQHTSQSDIDEIENLFHVSVQPATLEVPPSSNQPPSKPAPQQQKVSQSMPLLPPGGNSSSSGGPGGGGTQARQEGFGSPPNTLNEPVTVTLKRDFYRIVNNLRQVVFPNPYREDVGRALRDWDLWGPFFFIIFLALTLSWTSPDKSAVFGIVFGVLSSGAIVLTLNVLLLGGRIIFFQSLSVLGYCLFPLDVGAIACSFIESRFIRTIVVFGALAWSSWSAYPFVSGAVPAPRRALAVYPVFLLFVSVGFLVLAND